MNNTRVNLRNSSIAGHQEYLGLNDGDNSPKAFCNITGFCKTETDHYAVPVLMLFHEADKATRMSCNILQ